MTYYDPRGPSAPPLPPPPQQQSRPQSQSQPPSQPQPQPLEPAQPMGPYYVGPRTNPVAIAALILSLFLPLGGIVAGHIALYQLKRSNEAGHGLAVAGTIIGYSLTGLTVLAVAAYILFFVGLFAWAISDPSLPISTSSTFPFDTLQS